MLNAAQTPGPRAQAIIDAAYDLLDESGLEGLTIRAVLARTGLARRAFYDNFAGKDDLVLAVFEQSLRLAAQTFAELVANIPDAVERLRRIITAIVIGRADQTGGGRERRAAALAREHLRLAEARPEDLQRAIAPLIDLIATHLSDGIAAGQVHDAPVQRQAVLLYNLVSTTVHTELLASEGDAPDLERRQVLAGDIWSFCVRTIAA